MTMQEIGAVIGIAATVAGLGVGVFRWMLKGHEDVCAQRYAGIISGHEQLEKTSDERHRENLERMKAHDTKLDQIIQHLLVKR
jgi:hypothetical protein